MTGSPYIATDTVYVANGVKLTIEPGVTVRFATETSLICYGTLNAIGNPTGTITFTSSQTTPSAGDWKGIKLSGSGASGSQISWCNIGYAKQAVYLENISSIVIINNYIHDNKGNDGGLLGEIGCGIYLYQSTNNIISENSIFQNTGGQGGRTSWDGVGGRGGIGCGIYLSNSTNNAISENTILNNTGGNGGAGDGHSAGGQPGNGYGIYIESNSYNNTITTTNTYNNEPIHYYCNQAGITIENQILTLAGSGSTNLGRIVLINCSNFTIRNNTISGGIGQNGITGSYGSSGGPGGIGCGIYLETSTNGTITNNTIFQNTGGRGGAGGLWGSNGSPGQCYGIYSISNSNPTIHCNNLSANKNGDLTKGYGVYHDGSSGTISATYNWWGANSGPEHPITNPSGQGDKVSDWVDYRPYLTGTFTGPSVSLVPTSGLIGTEVKIESYGFATESTISITFATHSTITTTQSSPLGTFSTTFVVSTQSPGTKVITATDSYGNYATTTFILLPPTFLRVIPQSRIVAKGDEFVSEIKIDDVRNMAVVGVYLSFDPDVLEVSTITEGGFPSGGMVMKKTFNNANGHIDYSVGLLSGSSSGSGVLCSIRFRGKEGGTSSIRFDFDILGNRNTKIIDTQSNLIPFNKEESLIYVATGLSIFPKDKTIMAGNSQIYNAYAICGGLNVDVTGSTTFTSNGGGSWTTNSFEAHYIGTYTITGTFLSLMGTTSVIITPGTPTSLIYVSGNNQTQNCQETLANPFVCKVEDFYHNPCDDVLIDWEITENPIGASGFSLSATQTLTNLQGTSATYLTLGTEPPGTWTIEARNTSLSGSPIIFKAYSLRRFGSISGTSLIDRGTEAQRQAGILVRLVETGETKTTNADSYFIFSNIPVGTYTLSFTYPGATPATKTDVLITKTQFNDTTDIGTITLIAGDPNGDGQINILTGHLRKTPL
ncbi:MAG: right-handed parallel beta-helix repeat-containing protein [bacterium]